MLGQVQDPGDPGDRTHILGAPVGQRGQFAVPGEGGLHRLLDRLVIAFCAVGVSIRIAGSPTHPANPAASPDRGLVSGLDVIGPVLARSCADPPSTPASVEDAGEESAPAEFTMGGDRGQHLRLDHQPEGQRRPANVLRWPALAVHPQRVTGVALQAKTSMFGIDRSSGQR